MLILQNISKTFNPGTVNQKKALSNVSLELTDGDFATIVGSNGAGKSTLFNAVTGAFFVDEGRIYLDGENITYKPEHLRSRDIGHLFQDPQLGTAPHMTIEENLTLAYMRAGGKRYSGLSRISSRSDFFQADSVRHSRFLWQRSLLLRFCCLTSILPHSTLQVPRKSSHLPRR